MARKPVNRSRMSAHLDGDFVVFMTSMRINRYWKVHKWWPNVRANIRVLSALTKHKEQIGFLGGHIWIGLRGPLVITYFRSLEHLERFANDSAQPHVKEWHDYFRRIGDSADVAVWHEMFAVRSGEWEAVYDYMPHPIGLARAGEYVPIARKGDKSRHRRSANQKAAAGQPEPVAGSV